MKRSLRKRVGLYHVVVTGVLGILIFAALYVVVHRAVYDRLDEDLKAQSLEVCRNIVTLSDRIAFSSRYSWEEGRQGQAEVNPVFLEVVGLTGRIIKKSENLKGTTLDVDTAMRVPRYVDGTLAGAPIRQMQMPIQNPQLQTLGFLVIAIPREEADVVLRDLRIALFLAFPVLILATYAASRSFANRTIRPIMNVIRTAEKITEENLRERITPPPTRDELYRLTATINGLLDRLQDALVREQQFTADAAHELITPLASLKGTLEVMIRKPRGQEYYVRKIASSIEEVNRMSHLVDQLLTIARADSGTLRPSFAAVDLGKLAGRVIDRMEPLVHARGLHINMPDGRTVTVSADTGMLERMLENILSNAIKFSPGGGCVELAIGNGAGGPSIAVIDHGLGMTAEQTARIFDRFFRSDQSRSSTTPGAGLGLAIVKRLADLQHIGISVESAPSKGTRVLLTFHSEF